MLGHYLVGPRWHRARAHHRNLETKPRPSGVIPNRPWSLPTRELSRRHAQLSLVQGHIIVEDFQSTNGTFVDGVRLEAPVQLREGSLLQFGRQVLKYERRDRRDVERSQELNRELMKASNYVLTLLPPADRYRAGSRPAGDSSPRHSLVETCSATTGSTQDTFMMYLVDVSGHGLGAAMHSVSVMNVLRQQALPGVDFTNPAEVLATLNDRFQMDAHNGMFFTIWYGIYKVSTGIVSYSTAGHHAAYLVPPDKSAATPLAVPSLMIGAMPEMTYEVQQTEVPAGSALYLFSDGVFEIVTHDQKQWGLADFVSHILAPSVPGTSEPERLYQTVRAHARPGLFDDDFSLVVFTFE